MTRRRPSPKYKLPERFFSKARGGHQLLWCNSILYFDWFWLYKWCRYDHTHIDHIVTSCNMLHIMLSVREKFHLKIPRQVKLEYVHRFEGGRNEELCQLHLHCWQIHLKSFHWHLLLNYSYLMSSLYSTSLLCVVFFCLSFFFGCQMWIQEGATNL